MKTGNWKKELARDFIALGSWVFYVLVIARILVLPYKWPYLYHIIIAGVLILILEVFIKDVDYYASRALILTIFTILFYNNKVFTIFALLAFIGLLASSWYINKDFKIIIFGFLLGVVSVVFGFLIGDWLT